MAKFDILKNTVKSSSPTYKNITEASEKFFENIKNTTGSVKLKDESGNIIIDMLIP